MNIYAQIISSMMYITIIKLSATNAIFLPPRTGGFICGFIIPFAAHTYILGVYQSHIVWIPILGVLVKQISLF